MIFHKVQQAFHSELEIFLRLEIKYLWGALNQENVLLMSGEEGQSIGKGLLEKEHLSPPSLKGMSKWHTVSKSQSANRCVQPDHLSDEGSCYKKGLRISLLNKQSLYQVHHSWMYTLHQRGRATMITHGRTKAGREIETHRG